MVVVRINHKNAGNIPTGNKRDHNDSEQRFHLAAMLRTVTSIASLGVLAWPRRVSMSGLSLHFWPTSYHIHG